MDTVTQPGAKRTVLVVTHQLTGLARFDRILVMREGRLVEQGSYDELIARGGYFRELLGHQLRGEHEPVFEAARVSAGAAH